MKNLPPLSGAILISNPRKGKDMALALKNPNDRRRINKLTRLSVQSGMSPKAAVSLWMKDRTKPANKRDQRLRRGDGKSTVAHITSGKAKKQSKKTAAKYAKVRREIAKEFGKQQGYKPRRRRSGRFSKKGRVVSYAGAAVGSKARRYRSKAKITTAGAAGSWYKGRRKPSTIQIVNIPGVEIATEARMERRKTGSADRKYAAQVRKSKARKKTSKGKSVAAGSYRALVKQHGVKKASQMWRAKKNGLALTNPFGGLALTNPPVISALLSAGTLAAGAAGGFFTLNWVQPMVEEWYEPIPVVRDWPATTTGVLASAALAMVAGSAWMNKMPDAARLVGVLAAGVAASGVVVDLSSGFGSADMEFDDELGGLALENLGALALENDGMAYEVAPLTASAGDLDYSGADLADAYYSGADFDAAEGQALINGRGEWMRRFGATPRSTRRFKGRASHLAGRHGHRWGWLVKMVGFQRARAIASLPPKKRLSVLRSLRANAIATWKQIQVQDDAIAAQGIPTSTHDFVQPSAGTVASAAAAPAGPSGAGMSDLGSALFTSN